MKFKTLRFFRYNFWVELNRYNEDGNLVGTVTCTPDNFLNLYNSQLVDKTTYGEVFYYELYNE